MSTHSSSKHSKEPVCLKLDGSVAHVFLQSPHLNIFDLAMRDGLIEVLTAVSDMPEVRVMVLRTNGPNFAPAPICQSSEQLSQASKLGESGGIGTPGMY